MNDTTRKLGGQGGLRRLWGGPERLKPRLLVGDIILNPLWSCWFCWPRNARCLARPTPSFSP